MRRLIILFAIAAAFVPFVVAGQDDISAGEPTIDSPEVGVETPDSSMPDNLEDAPLGQWWQGVAGVISAGLASLFIRWTPASLWLRLGPARTIDLKRGLALGAAVLTGIVGAWLADTLAFDKVTLSGILYTAAAGWLTREVIPGAKALTHSIEGSAPPVQVP